ncbi:MAG: aromatic amino acid ammonia-lyase, partial [Paenibacillus sp.]|uniref:aromatic amino acid ammonia-lyase n=1 Tax=Paenibacillus sp. TaxID=58172 RepID=UPI00290108A2
MQLTAASIVRIDGHSLTIGQIVDVARHGLKVTIDEDSVFRMKRTRQYVEKLLNEKKVVYGLTTGFGKFSETYISAEDAKRLQLNLIRSHSCGIGRPFAEEIVRAIMLLRINALCLGYSGIRPEVVQLMADMLNRGVTPVVPEQGSLGASGDLAPLSHLALVILGEGEAWYRGEQMPGGLAMERAGLVPIGLEAKEGLALINGTQAMTAVGALALWDAQRLAAWADCTAALTCEALYGVQDAFEPMT